MSHLCSSCIVVEILISCFFSKFGNGGVFVVDGLVCGGHSNLFYLAFLFTGVLRGLGRTFYMWHCLICRFSIVV